MIIRPKNYKASQLSIRFTDHFIASILSFLLAFISLFFISGKSDVRHNSGYLDYLIEHPSFYLVICVLITLIVNIILVIKNLEIISIREFNFYDDSLLIISYKKGYRNTDYKIEMSLDSICVATKNVQGFFGDTTKIFEISSKDNIVIELDVSDDIWSSDKFAIRDLFTKINMNRKHI